MVSYRLVARPFSRHGARVIMTVSALHLYQAVMMLHWPSAGQSTCLIALLNVLHALDSPDGRVFMAITMVVTAALALMAAFLRLGWMRLAMFMPQHFILGTMAFGGIWASVVGHYLDGVIVTWQQISTDQMGLMALFIVHTDAILRRSRDPSG
jgi:hypothetical protein